MTTDIDNKMICLACHGTGTNSLGGFARLQAMLTRNFSLGLRDDTDKT